MLIYGSALLAGFLPFFLPCLASLRSLFHIRGCQPALSRGIRGEGKCLEYLKRNDLPCRQNFIGFFFCSLLSLRKSETPRRGCSMYGECCVLPLFMAGWLLADQLSPLAFSEKTLLCFLPSAAGATWWCCLMTRYQAAALSPKIMLLLLFLLVPGVP